MNSIFRSLAAIAISAVCINAHAQCTLLANATADITLPCTGGTTYRSGVAFNPVHNLYYSVNSGSGNYPMETYDINGVLVNSVLSGFDYRGLWWNAALGQLEGNGFNMLGWAQEHLGANGYPLGSTTLLFGGKQQPGPHSCGQLDSTTNEVLFYSNGTIYRYDRATSTYLGSYPLAGLPVSPTSLDSTSVLYTNCPGMEIGVYDYANRRVYVFDKATGAYAGMSQLPNAAPVPTNQRLSYANDRVFIYDVNASAWKSYVVLVNSTGVAEQHAAASITISPNPFSAETFLQAAPALNNARIEVFDAVGRRVFRLEDVSGSRVAIAPRGLSAGAYVLRVFRGTGLVAMLKLVVE